HVHTRPSHPTSSLLSLHDALPISVRGVDAIAYDRGSLRDLGRGAAEDRTHVFADRGEPIGPRRRPPGERRAARVEVVHHVVLRPDRKSTRLNSSHLGISYAVFCLK